MKKIDVVGLGPGAGAQLTAQSRQALEQADVLCGYTVYTDLIRGEYPDKPVISTGMMQEVERCQRALELADEGKRVAMVCSGDPGVYGMAGLILELSPQHPDVEIEVVPGITALLGGAAILGAPLTHDFAVISLSDLLTPWETIERRLSAAGEADFVVCLYNPSSRRRAGHLKRACEILLRCRGGDTVCGWVRNIGREGQKHKILTLGELQDEPVDMFTTVFIGNSTTKELHGRMVTPRGYENKR